MTNDDGNGADAGHAGASAGLGLNPDPRAALQWIVVTYGMPVATDLRRLKPLLADLCSSRKRENLLLINAAQEGIPAQLLSVKTSLLPSELLLSRLSLHLEENLLVTHNVARWAVESWALALGRITADELTTQQLNAPRAATPVKAPTPPVKIDLPLVPPEPEIVDEAEEESQAAVVVPPVIDSGTQDDPYRGWNWSAFFLGWIWLFGHKLWRWGIVSFLVCCCICVFSQEYAGFLDKRDFLAVWEDTLGEKITQAANQLFHKQMEPLVFGVPIAEYLAVLVSFLPVGFYGNRLLQQRAGGQDATRQKFIERVWKWCGLAALVVGPLGFIPLNTFLDWLLNELFPT